WTQVGGTNNASVLINGSWGNSYQMISSLVAFSGDLYAGVGHGTGVGELWKWSGSGNWIQVGGDASGSSGQSWTTADRVASLSVWSNKLYIGLGTTTGIAEVWECSPGCTATSGWSMIGGDGVSGSWADGTYESVMSLTIYNGELFAGLGTGQNDGEIWKFNGSSWSNVATAGSLGWPSQLEEVNALQTYRGKLYAGTGLNSNSDAYVFSYGNNAYLQSTSVSQDTAWHHIAATFDGTTMKLFRDGVLDGSQTSAVSIGDNTRPLLVGADQGGGGKGQPQAFFSGNLDEVRISSSARGSFTTKPYSAVNETVQPVQAVFSTGVATWDSFADSETLNGGTVNFRLSYDGGSTWKYWDGGPGPRLRLWLKLI
ncbi:MAG: LamG-like jellyroll fold domain-containing protein, partial [Candidatus Andersenbacteria bacterium]